MSQTSSAGDWPAPGRAWAWVFLLLLAYTSSFIDRQILSLMVDPISRDLGVTDTQFSLLQGLAFAVFYTLMGIPLGMLADTLPRRAVISASVAVWSAMTALCGLSNSFGKLFLARVGVGVGEAGLSPAAYSILADCFPRERLGRAMSVYLIGSAAGAGLAMMFGGAVISLVSAGAPVRAPLVGELAPWQTVFLWMALPGLPIAALMWLLKEPVRRQRADTRAPPFSQVFAFIGRRIGFLGPYTLGLSCLSATAYGIMAWGPAFFMRAHGFSPMQTGLAFGAVCIGAMTAGLLGGAWLTERMALRRQDAPLRTCVLGVVLGAPFGIAAGVVADPTLGLALFAVCLCMFYLPWGVALAVLQTVTPNEMRGRVNAVYLFMSNLIGQAVGPFMVAVFTERLFQDKAQVGASIALTIAILAPLSLVGLLFAWRRFGATLALAEGWLGDAGAAR